MDFRQKENTIIQVCSRVLALIVIAAVFIICNFEGLLHSSNNSINSVCGAACLSHSQAEQVYSLRWEFDEKEPSPPPYSWIVIPVLLATLYLSTKYGEHYIIRRNKLFLTYATWRF